MDAPPQQAMDAAPQQAMDAAVPQQEVIELLDSDSDSEDNAMPPAQQDPGDPHSTSLDDDSNALGDSELDDGASSGAGTSSNATSAAAAGPPTPPVGCCQAPGPRQYNSSSPQQQSQGEWRGQGTGNGGRVYCIVCDGGSFAFKKLCEANHIAAPCQQLVDEFVCECMCCLLSGLMLGGRPKAHTVHWFMELGATLCRTGCAPAHIARCQPLVSTVSSTHQPLLSRDVQLSAPLQIPVLSCNSHLLVLALLLFLLVQVLKGTA
jgi:hypothetical protein